MTVTIHKNSPHKDRYEDFVCVGSTPTHLRLASPLNTCLKKVCNPWATFDADLNMGFCRLPLRHEGDCADEVFYCDICDGCYPVDGDVEEHSCEQGTVCGNCIR